MISQWQSADLAALPPALAEGEVHLWYASLELPTTTILTLRTLLSADELARAKRFHFERDRRRFIVARGLLRLLLGRYLSLSSADIRFDYSDFGKPALHPEQNPQNLCFNVSHSGEMVIYAMTQGRRIGVDVEELRALDGLEQIAASFFSSRENNLLRTLPDAQKQRAFFNCWTRKEAFIKADGQGLSLGLDSFDVTLHPHEPAQLLEVRKGPAEETENAAERWTLAAVETSDGYVAAVVVEGRDVVIHPARELLY